MPAALVAPLFRLPSVALVCGEQQIALRATGECVNDTAIFVNSSLMDLSEGSIAEMHRIECDSSGSLSCDVRMPCDCLQFTSARMYPCKTCDCAVLFVKLIRWQLHMVLHARNTKCTSKSIITDARISL